MIWASKQVGAPKTGELLDRLCLAATRAAPPISRRISSAGARAVVVEAVGGNGGEGGGGGGGGVRGDVVRAIAADLLRRCNTRDHGPERDASVESQRAARLLARKRGWHQDAWIVLAGASQAVM